MMFDCQTCGACCSYSHDWPEFTEADDDATLDKIPDEFVDATLGKMRCEGDRCSALAGVVGQHVACRVYEHRPAVCRYFPPGHPGCLKARASFGLPT
jgi:Fe-S-cluster containining protein